MKNILIITYFFPPTAGAGVQRPLKFVKYFPQYNFRPVVCTPNPYLMRHPKDKSFLAEIPPEAKIYHTFILDLNWLFKILYGFKLNILVEWINNHLLFPGYTIQWLPFLKLKLLKIFKKEKIEAVYITAPPYSNLLIAKWIKNKFNVPVLFDLRDPFTFNIESGNYNLNKKRFNFENSLYKYTDLITVVSPQMEKMLKKEFVTINTAIITNGFDEQDFTSVKEKKQPAEKRILSFIGKTYNDYNTMPFLKALKKIVSEKLNIEIRFIGIFTKKEIEFIEENNLSSIVKLIPFCSHEEAIQYNQESDALLLVIANDNWKHVVTGKVFEYIRSNKPIFAIIPEDGDCAEILNKTKTAHLIVSPKAVEENPNILLEALISEWNINPNQTAIKLYDRKLLTKKLAELISDML